MWSQLQIRGGIHIIFFLFLHEKICCGYSLEAPRRGASNEYPQHMFSLRNKKDISSFRVKKSALSVAMSNCISLFVLKPIHKFLSEGLVKKKKKKTRVTIFSVNPVMKFLNTSSNTCTSVVTASTRLYWCMIHICMDWACKRILWIWRHNNKRCLSKTIISVSCHTEEPAP